MANLGYKIVLPTHQYVARLNGHLGSLPLRQKEPKLSASGEIPFYAKELLSFKQNRTRRD